MIEFCDRIPTRAVKLLEVGFWQIGKERSDEVLQRGAINKKFLLVHNEGERSVKRNISHYNLDMILYRAVRELTEVGEFNEDSKL